MDENALWAAISMLAAVAVVLIWAITLRRPKIKVPNRLTARH